MLSVVNKSLEQVGQLLGRGHTSAGRALLRFSPEVLITAGDDGLWCDGELAERQDLQRGPLTVLAATDSVLAVGGPEGLTLLKRGDLTVTRFVALPVTAIGAGSDRFLVGNEAGRLCWIDAASGAIEELAERPSKVVAIEMLANGAAVLDRGNLAWLTEDGVTSRPLDELAPDHLHGADFLRAHPAEGRVLLGIRYEEMCLYVGLRLLSYDPATREQDELNSGDGTLGEPYILPNGTTAWIGGRHRSAGYDKVRECWNLAVRGLGFTAVLTEAGCIHTLDNTGALRRFVLNDLGVEPVPCGEFVGGRWDGEDKFATWDASTRWLRWWSTEDGAPVGQTQWGYHQEQRFDRTLAGRFIASGDSSGTGRSARLQVLGTSGDAEPELLWDASTRLGSVSAASRHSAGGVVAAAGQVHRIITIGNDFQRFSLTTDHLDWGGTVTLSGGRIGKVGRDGHIAVWNASGCLWAIREGHSYGASMGAVGDHVVVVQPTKGLGTLHDGTTGEVLRMVQLPESHALSMVRESPVGDAVIVSSGAYVWGSSLAFIDGTEGLRAEAISDDGRFIFGDLGYDKPRVVVDTEARSVTERPEICEPSTRQASIFGETLVVGADDGEVVFFDLPTATVRHRFRAHQGAIRAIAMDDQRLVTTGTDGTIAAWTHLGENAGRWDGALYWAEILRMSGDMVEVFSSEKEQTSAVRINLVTGALTKVKLGAVQEGVANPCLSSTSYDQDVLLVVDPDTLQERIHRLPFAHTERIRWDDEGGTATVAGLTQSVRIDLTTGELEPVKHVYRDDSKVSNVASWEDRTARINENGKLEVTQNGRMVARWDGGELLRSVVWPRADRIAVIDALGSMVLLGVEPSSPSL